MKTCRDKRQRADQHAILDRRGRAGTKSKGLSIIMPVLQVLELSEGAACPYDVTNNAPLQPLLSSRKFSMKITNDHRSRITRSFSSPVTTEGQKVLSKQHTEQHCGQETHNFSKESSRHSLRQIHIADQRIGNAGKLQTMTTNKQREAEEEEE